MSPSSGVKIYRFFANFGDKEGPMAIFKLDIGEQTLPYTHRKRMRKHSKFNGWSLASPRGGTMTQQPREKQCDLSSYFTKRPVNPSLPSDPSDTAMDTSATSDVTPVSASDGEM